MPWSRTGDGPSPLAGITRLRWRRIHHIAPVLPVAIPDEHRDRRTNRVSGAHAREELRGILLDLHSSPAPVALLAAREISIHIGREQRNACRGALEYRDERWSVRFSRGSKTKHDPPNARARHLSRARVELLIPSCRIVELQAACRKRIRQCHYHNPSGRRTHENDLSVRPACGLDRSVDRVADRYRRYSLVAVAVEDLHHRLSRCCEDETRGERE